MAPCFETGETVFCFFGTETGALFARRIFGDVDLYLSALHEGRLFLGGWMEKDVFFLNL